MNMRSTTAFSIALALGIWVCSMPACQTMSAGDNANTADDNTGFNDNLINDNDTTDDPTGDNAPVENENIASTENDNAAGSTDGNGAEACTELTYDNFAAGFFASYCLFCHDSALTGIDRNGAPSNVNFDTLDGVLDELDRIRVRATEQKTMPPSSAPALPSDGERTQLQEWIDCGAPT